MRGGSAINWWVPHQSQVPLYLYGCFVQSFQAQTLPGTSHLLLSPGTDLCEWSYLWGGFAWIICVPCKFYIMGAFLFKHPQPYGRLLFPGFSFPSVLSLREDDFQTYTKWK